VKDRGFWMGTPSATEVPLDETTASQTSTGTGDTSTSESAPSQSVTQSGTSASSPTKAKSRVESHPGHAVHEVVATPITSLPTITASNRAALPPLEIEVVAGDQHRMIQPINPSLKVDLQTGSAPIPAPATTPPSQATSTDGASVATNAGERVRLSPDTAERVARPVEPNYPMLAKQMKVQGSVVLQALIGREGGIQDLRVLSGPAILSTAAMDAVKQWRFRPYFQAGQSVETEARITVNFTISTY